MGILLISFSKRRAHVVAISGGAATWVMMKKLKKKNLQKKISLFFFLFWIKIPSFFYFQDELKARFIPPRFPILAFPALMTS